MKNGQQPVPTVRKIPPAVTELQPAGDIVIVPNDMPVQSADEPQIHARHPLPMVPEHANDEPGKSHNQANKK